MWVTTLVASVSKMYVYPEAREIFPTVEIKSGLCYYLHDSSYSGKCHYVMVEGGKRIEYDRDLSDSEILIRNTDFTNERHYYTLDLDGEWTQSIDHLPLYSEGSINETANGYSQTVYHYSYYFSEIDS